MLLVIDVGNTNSVFAVYNVEDIVGSWRLATESKRTSDEYALSLKHLMADKNIKFTDIKNIIIACVVPESLFAFRRLARDYFKVELMVVGENSVSIPIKVKLERPEEVGADRLVNAVAVSDKYPGSKIVIDFGTATTFDVVNDKGEYLGGVIAPGVDLSLHALHAAAAKLPKVAVGKPEKVIGKNTIQAMRSGAYWGYIGLVEGIVEKIKSEYGKKMTVVATGGLSPLFGKATKVIDHLEPDLTIEGLKQIFEINKNNVVNIQKNKK